MAALRPLRIGLSANIFHPDPSRLAYKGRRLLFTEESMAHWLLRGAALPLMLPTIPSDAAQEHLAALVGVLDGVILTGGVDMAPESYGETPLRPEWAGDKQRDDYEIALIHAALAQDKPLLGICRGHQVLNVAMGGSLYQDVRTQHPGSQHHRIYDVYEGHHHGVSLVKGGTLAGLFGQTSGQVNSVHHQAVKKLAPSLVAEAWSQDDQVIEALRLADPHGPFLLGVQWHPEMQDAADQTLLPAGPILQAFLAAARRRAE